MRRWLIIAVPLSAFFGAFAMTGKALAQSDFEVIPPVIADIMVKTGVIVDGVLGTWVSGNNLTHPRGEDLVASLGHIAVAVTHFFATAATLF
jgi:hypothetical protein